MSSYTVIVIDDLRVPVESESPDVQTWLCRSLDSGFTAVSDTINLEIKIDELWLDHDLGPSEDIRPLVLWLEELAVTGIKPDIGHVFIHTGNPVAADWMIAALTPHYATSRAELPTQ